MNKKTLLTVLMAGMTSLAMAQANYWNLNGTYVNCNTGVAEIPSGTWPSLLHEMDASSFVIPGLCRTYCKLSFGNPGPGAGNTIVLNHITEGESSSIPGFIAGKKQIMSGSAISAIDASYTAGQLQSDGTRIIYARAGNVIYQVCTLMPDGSTSGSPTAIYTPAAPSGSEFDQWTNMEISSNGRYLLFVGGDAKNLTVFDLTTNTPTYYPAPGGTHGRIQGVEFVSFATPRLFISYNSKNAANPGGTGGIGYYNLGNTTTFNSIAPPSGTTATDFGFTEIERAKNGLLYLARNASGSYDFSGTGDVYSLDPSAGTWTLTPFTVQASDNTSYSAYCDKYYIQTQIDGENYDAGYYPTPSILLSGIQLQGVNGGLGVATAASVYRCGSDPLLLKIFINPGGLVKEYTVTVTSGTISGSVFTAGSLGSVTHTETSAANSIELTLMPSSFVPASFVGTDWKVEITPKGACTTGPTAVRYFKVQPITVLGNYNAYRESGLPGIIDNKKPLQETPLITSLMPTGADLDEFKLATHLKQGWAGATSVGITNVNTSSNYTVSVYEVDASTGVRKPSAPDVAYTTGPMCTGSCSFNFNSKSKKFNATKAPFYLDATSTFSGYSYFIKYYEWAEMMGPDSLIAFSAKTWCCELSVTQSGCTAVKKSFFRIASRPAGDGQYAKPAGINGDDQETTTSLNIYPNPASTTTTVTIPSNTRNATLLLMDNSGRKVLEINNLKTGKQEIDIQRLSSGIYFYQINVDGQMQHGKLIKQ